MPRSEQSGCGIFYAQNFEHMTIEEFTLYTGYVPNNTAEFDAIERDRQVFNAPAKRFCSIWIKCYYTLKASEVMRRRRVTKDIFEAEACTIMLQNMKNAYHNANK